MIVLQQHLTTCHVNIFVADRDRSRRAERRLSRRGLRVSAAAPFASSFEEAQRKRLHRTQWDIGESKATLLTRVDIPECSCITAVGFAGEDLSELYVTTSRFFPGPTSKANDGKLFRVTGTGAKGLPSHAFDG